MKVLTNPSLSIADVFGSLNNPLGLGVGFNPLNAFAQASAGVGPLGVMTPPPANFGLDPLGAFAQAGAGAGFVPPFGGGLGMDFLGASAQAGAGGLGLGMDPLSLMFTQAYAGSDMALEEEAYAEATVEEETAEETEIQQLLLFLFQFIFNFNQDTPPVKPPKPEDPIDPIEPEPVPDPKPVPDEAFAEAEAGPPNGEVVSEATPAGAPAQVWGDPHFVSFDGKNYDVQGSENGIYNIISDKKLQYNAKFGRFTNPGTTIISEVGFKIGDPNRAVRVQFSATGPATVNGEVLQPGTQRFFRTGIRNQQGQEVQGYARLSPDGNVFTINTGEYSITFTRKNVDGVPHLDQEVRVNGLGTLADGKQSHGLLGQTADYSYANRNAVEGAKQGEGMIDGNVEQYRVSDLFADNFAYNRYGSEGGPAQYGYRAGGGGRTF